MSDFVDIHHACNQKLQIEQNNILSMKDTVSHLDGLTTSILEVLDGLDKKLTDMETLLLPVRGQTDMLKLKATNAEQTLSKLKSVQDFYNTISTSDQLIDLGPASCDLSVFLDAMTKLKAADNFFDYTNPGTRHATTARKLYTTGREKLIQYLDKIVVQYAGHLSIPKLADCIDDIFDIKQFPELMPEAGVERVSSIWQWFEINNPPSQGLLPDYAEVIGRALARSLGQLLAKLNEYLARCISESDLAPDLTGSVSQRRSSLALRERRTHSAYTTLPPQSLQGSGSLRQATPSGPSVNSRSHLATPTSAVASTTVFEDPACQSSMVTSLCAACFVLMKAHNNLLSRIIGCHKNSMSIPIAVILVDRITKSLFDDIGDSTASLCKAARKNAHQAPATSAALLVAMQQIENLIVALDRQNEGRPKSPKVGNLASLPLPERACKKLNDSLAEVKRVAATALHGLLLLAAAESIVLTNNSDTSSTTTKNLLGEMPRDGTVHSTTAGVIRAFEDLLPLSKLAGQALSQQQTQSNLTKRQNSGTNTSQSSVGVGFAATMTWQEFEEKLRMALVAGIQRRSEYYGDDASLRSIFILNNCNYVLKNLQRIDSAQKQKTSGKHYRSPSDGMNWQGNCEKLIKQATVSYLSVWGHLGSLVTIPPAHPNKDKERQAIKDKFSAFNGELESLTTEHRKYSVADLQQRQEILNEAATEVILPYKIFLDRYASSNFTSNRGKYIKYSEDDIKRLISTCLTGQFMHHK